MAQLKDDYRQAELDDRVRVMLDYARKLTRSPHSMTRDDVEALRAVGFEDADIADINLVSAYFNMLNRIASGLGVEGTPALGAHSS